jgi:23S rRNA (guanosine2251-2'-O)-methyltransferase
LSDTKQANEGALIAGRNPVLEALKSGREIERLVVQKGATGSIEKILRLAKAKGVPVRFEERSVLERMAGGAVHQGVLAIAAAYRYADVEDLFALAEEREEDPFFVVLDGVEDPHNLGAIIRTAECAGAHGVIIPKRRAAGVTETVLKSAAGAAEYLPVARVANITQTLGVLKKRGVWIYACDMDGENYTGRDLTGPAAIVIGAEGRGISRLVRETCDGIVSIPMRGRINSLNASNAAAILLYEIRRQRDEK